jgi:Ca2+-binding RTX toxin-like protein
MATDISAYLKFANLQMAAEADYLNVTDFTNVDQIKAALVRGNNRSSKFTTTQVDQFIADGWTIVENKSNTSTGFSGTLFKYTGITDAAKGLTNGELVLSFRSTEFADDAARDNQATNGMEIRPFGWAFGQISDMQSWVDELLDGNKINLQQSLTVTGYSLGGHLATAFDLLYPNAATSIYTFNGAGVGLLNNRISLGSVISAFDQRRSTGSNADLFTDASVRDFYDSYKSIVSYVNGVVTLEVIDSALLQAKTLATQLSPNTAGYGEASLLVKALQRSKDIAFEAARVTNLSSGNGTNAVGVALASIEAIGLDYQLAVLKAGENTSSYGDEDAVRKAFGGLARTTENRINVFDLYGATTPSMVSNSQRHLGISTPIWIEDQPLLRGSAAAAVYDASSFANGVKLLVPNFSANDFGDTHSLVLLVDSLNVQNTLAQLDPSLDAAKLKNIFNSASNAKVETGFISDVGINNQGKADGDTLERVVNALADMLGMGWKDSERLKGSLDGNTWALTTGPTGYSGRTMFYEKLKAITDTSTYEALLGNATIVPGNQAADAKTNFGSFLALHALSPFAIQTTDTTAIAKLKQANESLAQAWEADAELTLAQKAAGLGTFTNAWYADRAEMLKWVVLRNTSNQEDFRSPGVFEAVVYRDSDTSTLFSVANTSASPQTILEAKRVIFGGEDANELLGNSRDDHLYGGGGNDIIDGKAGVDYLEGNTGNDTLDGGTGNDILVGGQGSDTYNFSDAFGKDTILDVDGLGNIKVDGLAIGAAKAAGHNVWVAELAPGQKVGMSVYDDPRSSTGKKLVITRGGSVDNTITVSNFDLAQAQNGGYLGIQLEGTVKLFIEQGASSNRFKDTSFNPSTVTGTSLIKQGGGSFYSIFLNMAAKAGDTLTLALSALADKFQVNMGDIMVDANGAVITLAEGQDTVTFSLIQKGDVTADATALLSANYQGIDGQTGTTNNWTIDLRDIGETTKTFLGDQHGQIVPNPEDGTQRYEWSNTSWAADGTMTGGVVEEGYGDVIVGTIGKDSISGKGGDDALSGSEGDDQIDGGDGNDVIGGGRGSDTIKGGAGDDLIISSVDLTLSQRSKPDENWTPLTPGVGGPLTWDDAPDVIDAGDGNDTVYASFGGDRIDGGAGNDELWGLAGADIIEGGAGNDQLNGDGIKQPDTNLTTDPSLHGGDFLDGGLGNDTILGWGGSDALYGGEGNDYLYGDAYTEGFLLGMYHGEDYLDGEGGNDVLVGGGKDDTLYGGDGDDVLLGDGGESALAAEFHGNDYLDGEGGDDHLIGSGGNDTLYGGDDDDHMEGDATESVVAGEYHGDDYLDGEGGNDLLWGDGGNDTLYGGDGDDELQGDAHESELSGEYHGDDYLDGEDGDDLVIGDGGNDILYGGDGNDELQGDAREENLAGEYHGDDYLNGEGGNDRLFGAGGNDTLYGGDGNDFMLGDGVESDVSGEYHGTDYLDGGAGDDELLGNGGDDTLIGGAGKDKLYGDEDNESFLQGQYHGNDFLDGGEGDDYAEGGGGEDTVLGGAGDDILWGDAAESKVSLEFHGNDTLDGGEGADKLYGGGGNDVLLGGDGNDTLHGDAGNDRLEGGAGDDILMGGDGDDILIDTEGNNTFDAGAGDDSVTVGDMDNNLQGGEGRDVIVAGDGNNVINGGSGNDNINAGDGDNNLNGDDGNDVLVAGNGINTLSGGVGNDTITAGDGGNTLNGDEGSDTITAGSGNDTLSGGEGNDMLSAGDGNNTVLGGNGNDSLTSGAGADNLDGGYGNDTLHAGGGNDVLNGGDGDDMVYGDGGNDVLYASRGKDTLAGGDGLDTYVLNYGADRSNVVDDSPEGSVIKLGAAGMKFEDLNAVRRANDLVVEVRGTSASMRIKDYYASTQTSWVFEDAQGNTTTGEALVAASQTDWAQLQANLLKNFQSSALGAISRSYTETGYTQRTDGSWYLAANYVMGIAKTYDVRTEFSKAVHRPVDDPNHPWTTTSSYVSYAGWGTQQSGLESARDWTTSITFQSNTIASGTGTLQSYSYTTSTQNAWSAVQWTGDGGMHSESEWVYESSMGWPTEIIDYYTRYDLDSVYYEGTVSPLTFVDPGAAAQTGDLPDYVAVDFLHQQTGYNLGPSLLADGDQTVWADQYSAVIGGVGNNTIYGAGFAYGGTGNAQLIGGGTLMAGTGDQLLQFGQTMVVGDGHDTVVGRDSSRILVNPDNLGIDLIGQDFDWESDVGDFGQSQEIKAIYQAMGHEDWTKNYQYGGKYRLDFGEDFVGYFDSLEDARAAFVPSSAWPTFDIAMAYAFTTWQYVEPLTALYKTPYTTVEDPASGLVASSYYAAHGITPTMLTANDFAALQPLLQAELLPHGIVSFGPGLSLADLTLSWGEAVAPLDGATHVTLDILWGPDQGIRILMPRTGDALNSIVQQFEFSDGTVSSLLDLIALAPPAPDFDTGYARIYAGMGEQSADAADVAGIRALVASATDLKVESDGVDLVISIIGSSGDSLRIAGWYADSSAMSQAILFTSGAAVLSAAQMTDKGLFKDGSAGGMDLYGVPGFATTFVAGPNTRMTGNSGMDIYVYNAGSGEVHISDPGGGTMRFGSGISATATLGLGEGSLLIQLGNQGDVIYLENFDPSDAENFESVQGFEFANGSTLSLQDLLDQGFDLSGTSDADTIIGTSVTDRMLAGAGDDLLQGGRGDDTLDGGAGSDVYLFSRGDGVDIINEVDATVGNVDTIRFDDSVSVADVRVSRDGLNLYLGMDGSTDRIEVSNWFGEDADTVEQVEFADGTIWTKADVEARLPTVITGTDGNDQLGGSDGFEIFDGQGGNDLLEGGAGNDVYLFKRGDGQDTIADYDETIGNIDAVRFDSGISAADVKVTFDSNRHLFLSIDGTQDRITLYEWLDWDAGRVERVLFADGTVWNQEDLEAMAVFGPSEGNDYLDGTEDGDYLLGLGGDDHLVGEGGNDIIDGGSGEDYVIGRDGDDLLAGGAGTDVLDGGVGNDVYLYSRGDGTDYIADYDETVGNIDTLRFYDGTVAAADITVTRGSLDLYLQINGTGDRIELSDWFGDVESQLERVEFADGTVWDRAMLESLVTLAPATEDSDVLYGTASSEVLHGLAGDDELYGNGGNDTLDGGAGDDYLEGGAGNDVYLFGRGSGNDEISDDDETPGNIDTVRFDATVAPGDIKLTRDNSSLFLTIEGSNDRITLGGWFEDEVHQVEIIEFADGTVWNQADLEALPIVFVGTEGGDTLWGTDNADVIDGGAGNDILNGGAGNDVYLYTRGDGSDTIRDIDASAGNVDTVRFDETVTTADVQVTRDSNDLFLNINGTGNRITLKWFGYADNRVEQVQFADGTVWDTAALLDMAGSITYEGTAGDDMVTGSVFDDIIDGGSGDDILAGNTGSDVYLFRRGDGQDTIWEYDAATDNIDTIRFDSSVAASEIRFNRSQSHLYLSTDGTTDVIMLKNWFVSDEFRIEQVEFADGTLWNKTDFAAMANAAMFGGTDGNDFMVGAAGNDILKGLGGNDALDGVGGFDVLEGGAGNDVLQDTTGGNYYNAGAGADTLIGSAGADLLMGGTGNDVITTGDGPDVIAFNVGDGQDTIHQGSGLDDTVTLGGAGLDYANLSLQKSSNDLVLKISATDQLTFTNWYLSTANKTVLNLQLVAEAMSAFDANSGDPLLNKKVQTFDFQGLVGAFDAERTATPGLSSWALSNGLTQFHLAGSDSEALGGDLAYHYGADGTLAGMGLGKAQEVLTNAQFGAQAQAIHSTASLQEGLIRLG